MPVVSFRDLRVWQIGMELVESVYALTRGFPSDERHVLTAQLRRAAISIPSNLSEGHQHGGRTYRHHVTIAIGSLAEAETQIELARRLQLTTPDRLTPVTTLIAVLRPQLHKLRRSLNGPRDP